jgi:beta-alanine degradation protein BauB
MTHPHDHPNSVMYTLSSVRRRLTIGDKAVEVDKAAGEVSWLPAQRHTGHNIGDQDTHVLSF